MLMRAARANFDFLHDATRQLFTWTISRKKFHSTSTQCFCEHKGFLDLESDYERKRRFNDDDDGDDENDRRKDSFRRPSGYRNEGFRRPGGFRDDGFRRPGGFRDEGFRSGGFRDEGFRRSGGFRDEGFRRPGGFRDEGYGRPGGFRFDSSRTFNRSFGQRGGREYETLKPVSYNVEDLPKINKDFYSPDDAVMSRTKEEIQSFYSENEIQIFGNLGDKCPPPIFHFEELHLPPNVMDVIRNLNFTKPTPIQSMTWPIALRGLNLVGNAQTGSGKTLGFALPGFMHVKNQPRREAGDGPVALIIAPTRELAQQIEKVMVDFEECFELATACVFGGMSRNVQAQRLLRSDICIATPGRLMDFLSSGVVNLRRVSYFVLDEADRLLDMGFEPQIRSIMSQMRPDSQILMWSATWPKEVKILANDFLNEFIGVKFGSSELTVNPNITQNVYVCQQHEKLRLLDRLLDQIMNEGVSKTLIFSQTKRGAEDIQRFLRARGLKVSVIHSDISQANRSWTLENFRSGNIHVLVGTAVVARGLDIDDIRHVVVYDFPTSLEDYVHVIGRTGRKDKGTSHTFFTYNDIAHAKSFISFLRQCKQEVNPDLLGLIESRMSFRSNR